MPDTVLVAEGFPGTSSLPSWGAKAQVGEVWLAGGCPQSLGTVASEALFLCILMVSILVSVLFLRGLERGINNTNQLLKSEK